jgi:hypothetical protein
VYLTCIEEIEVYLQANDPFCKLEESRKLKKKDHKKLLSRGIVISSRLLFSYFTIDWFPLLRPALPVSGGVGNPIYEWRF